MALDFLSAVELTAEAGAKTTEIGGSERHIWFGAIYDEALLRKIAGRVGEEGITKDGAKQAERAAKILRRVNTAAHVEKAFGPLGQLEDALPALAHKSGAYAAGARVLMSLTKEEFAELQKRMGK